MCVCETEKKRENRAKKRKLTSTIEDHASCPKEFMVLDPPLLDELLSGDVADSKEDGGCHCLSEEWPSSQSGFVPVLLQS